MPRRNRSVGMTHGELQLYTIVKRQGSCGASQEFLMRQLLVSGTTLWQRINNINARLNGQRIKNDGVVYRLVDLEEAAFMASMARDPVGGDLVWA